MTAVYSVFIFALDSVIFALAMTIISILFYTILDKIIFSNKNMADFNWLIALLSLSIITCVLVIILLVQNLFQLDHRLQWDKRPCSYAPYESTTEYTDEDTESYDNTDDSDDFLMIQKATAMIPPMIPGMILLTLLMKIITKSPHGIL